jgi:hypothetical protein
MEEASGYLQKFLEWAEVFGPKLIGAIIVFVVGLYIVNYLSGMVSKVLNKRGIDVSLQSFFSSLVGVGLKVLLLISVAGMLGIQTTSFIAVIGALGLAVGLALQGSLANFAGGVLILVFKPFKVGDLIESNGQTGRGHRDSDFQHRATYRRKQNRDLGQRCGFQQYNCQLHPSRKPSRGHHHGCGTGRRLDGSEISSIESPGGP